MIAIILGGWYGGNWLGLLIPLVAFILLVGLGYRLSKWLFKKFLSQFFHEGERKWDDSEK